LTGGNPLFTVELVREWVARDLLVPTRQGLRLRGGEVELPEELVAQWRERLSVALRGRPAEERAALEIAAALGTEVDPAEWREACRTAGIGPPDGAMAHLTAQRLLRESDDHLYFAHPAFHAAVLKWASDTGRLAGWHRACAATLRTRDVDPARIGRHLVAAGRPGEAVDLLLVGAARARGAARYPIALSTARDALDALDSAAASPRDPRRGKAAQIVASMLSNQGRNAEARVALERLLGLAREHGWTELGVRAAVGLSRIARQEGSLREAEDFLAKLQDDRGDLHLRERAAVAAARGQVREAGERLTEALAVAPAGRRRAAVYLDQSGLALLSADPQAALRLAQTAVELSPGHANRTAVAVALARLGRREEAIARWQAELDPANALGVATTFVPRTYLAFWQLVGDDWAAAAETLAALRRIAPDLRSLVCLERLVRAQECWLAAGLGQEDRVLALLPELSESVLRHEPVNDDLTQILMGIRRISRGPAKVHTDRLLTERMKLLGEVVPWNPWAP
jgi:tetratricopeptide (TPR) repeat protein